MTSPGAAQLDVALVPSQAHSWPPTVCVVVDELRASSTITTLLDLGCTDLMLTADLDEARALARAHGSLLAGEHEGYTPPGFDANNSPSELVRHDVRGRSVTLCTTNGTVVIGGLRHMPSVLVGCLLNAAVCAEGALHQALALGQGIGLVCAGDHGRFALEDAVTAGVIVERLVAAAGSQDVRLQLSDAARAALQLRSTYPDVSLALQTCSTADLVRRIGAEEDLVTCARLDVSRSVPVVRMGTPIRVERLVTDAALV